MLAKTFRPQLNEPVRKIAKGIGVWHHDVDRLAVPRVSEPLQGCVDACGIFFELRRFAARRHLRGSFQKLSDVDSNERRGESSNWSKHTETPADIRRNIERWNPILCRTRA